MFEGDGPLVDYRHYKPTEKDWYWPIAVHLDTGTFPEKVADQMDLFAKYLRINLEHYSGEPLVRRYDKAVKYSHQLYPNVPLRKLAKPSMPVFNALLVTDDEQWREFEDLAKACIRRAKYFNVSSFVAAGIARVAGEVCNEWLSKHKASQGE